MADANAVKPECASSEKIDVSINLVKDDDIPLPFMEPISNIPSAQAVNGEQDAVIIRDVPIPLFADIPQNLPLIPNNEQPAVIADSKPTDVTIESVPDKEAVNPIENTPEIVAPIQSSAHIIPNNEENKVVTDSKSADIKIEAPPVIETAPILDNIPPTPTANGQPNINAVTQNSTPMIQNNKEPTILTDLNPAEKVNEGAKLEESNPAVSTNGPETAAEQEIEIQSNAIRVNDCASGNSEPLTNNIKSGEAAPNSINSSKPVIPVVSEDEWAKRERFLLEQIAILQKEQGDTSIKGYQLQLKVKTEENYILKAKIINLETELGAVLKKPNAKNKDIVEKIKKQHEDLLTKARGMLFDKTKMIKNQELQIEALGNQVSSLKEVVTITKDLLNIRNMEVEHLQQRMECMDLKIQAEKDRHALMVGKIDKGTKVNEDLKKEYETQLAIFKELKSKYEEKFQTLEKNQIQPSTSQEQS